MSRVDDLVAKALNQYKGRDVFAYLALRYAVENEMTRSNNWCTDFAPNIVKSSAQGSYIRSYHFKKIVSDGEYEQRDIFVPSAAESLAESSLLSECMIGWKAVSTNRSYSYLPTNKTSRVSFFEPYMQGLRQRQLGILEACNKYPDGMVAYIDIKSFYPSITPSAAAKAWMSFCDSADISEDNRDLGLKLISNHSSRSADKSVLTGPMFSHFVANLVLLPIDRVGLELPCAYFRYVDDITLVGHFDDIQASLGKLQSHLSQLGLEVHPADSEKSMLVPAREWRESAEDFNDSGISGLWMRLVGDIKKFLIFNPSLADSLEDALRAEGFRLPIPDYEMATRDANSFEKVRRLGLWRWLYFKSRGVGIDSIVSDARTLSNMIFDEVNELLSFQTHSPFQKKRMVSKIRYRLGRMLYLSTEHQLSRVTERCDDWPELHFHVAVAQAIITGDCSQVIRMGSNVAQATAQIFRATLATADFSIPIQGDLLVQGLAVFILNGVPVSGELASPDHPLIRFAKGPVDQDLMQQPRGLLQDLACLHGLGAVRHSKILRSVFDFDELITLDALDFGYGSYF